MELVSTRSADGVLLDGLLSKSVDVGSRAAGAALPVDIFICHHGVGSNFYDAKMYADPEKRLLAAGCDVLRVNNRGHDLVYGQAIGNSEALKKTRGRQGSAFEIVDDCRHDWTAWINFATERGYQRIGVWGHSLGAVKTIYFFAKTVDPRVRCAIASSPPRFCHQELLDCAKGAEFREAFDRARMHCDAGAFDALLSVTIPTFNIFSARTYVDKYGPGDPYDYMKLFTGVRTPLFVTLGGDERDSQYTTLAKNGDDALKAVAGGGFALIPGANHYYTGRGEELWSAVSGWLATIKT